MFQINLIKAVDIENAFDFNKKQGLWRVYMSQTETGLVNATFISNLIEMCKIVLVMKNVCKRAEPANYALI
jgi:hypothetical protein